MLSNTVTEERITIRLPHLTLNTAAPAQARRATPAAEDLLGAGADTYDWDTAFAIRFPDVNKQLAKPGSCPASFSATDSGSTFSGTFGPWLLSGGDGALVHMETPITSGNLFYNSQNYPVTDGLATIEVELQYLPQPVVSASAGTPNALVVKTLPGSPQQPVSVTNFVVNPDPGFVQRAVMEALLKKWFNDNLAEFTHSFSTVSLNMRADKEDFQWIKPTTASYAVLGGATPDEGVFGVLSMTGDRTPAGRHQLSPSAIPEGERSGFLVAGSRFLEKLLLPQIHTLFPGASPSDFEVANAGTQIRNVNTVYMEDVALTIGRRTPEIPAGQCTVTLEAEQLRFHMEKVHVNYSPGIEIYMDYTACSAIELVQKSDGTHALNYREASPPVIDHNVEMASWVIWTEVAVGVVATLATLGAGAWAKKAIENVTKRVVAIIIVALVGALATSIGLIFEALATGDKDKLPTVDLMMLNMTNPVKWPGSTGWVPTSASLFGSLRFGGDPQFVD